MDVVEIGQFLSLLRREQNMTQQELGERLGVTNKTVSRWENGNYMPPVEMLQQMSELYGITVNEILSASRLEEADYKERAEENIKSALRASAFTLKEKTEYYKRKWIKEHLFGLIVEAVLLLALTFAGVFLDNWLQLLGPVLAFFLYIRGRNEMMIYVEDRAFDGSGRQ